MSVRRSGLGSCPYYAHYADGGPLATCDRGCYSEPSCVTDEPAHGWRWRDTETGRYAKAPEGMSK